MRQPGFTLLETAVVSAIILLLLGGVMMPVMQYVEVRKIRQTQASLDNIQQTLLHYAVTHGRFPCPAQPNLSTGIHADAGLEQYAEHDPTLLADDECSVVQGVLPWRELGVVERDAWGRRFTYRISPDYAKFADDGGCGEQFSLVWFSLCTDARNEIHTSSINGKPVATDVVAVVVSHGANGYGGYTSTGKRIATTNASADEIENQGSGGNDRFFVQHAYHPDTFDDLLTWVAKPQLIARMVNAQKLP